MRCIYNVRRVDLNKALSFAIRKRDAAMAKCVLLMGANPNGCAKSSCSWLMEIVQFGAQNLRLMSLADRDVIIYLLKVLIEGGADIDRSDGFGDTALHYASRLAFKEAIELLLKYGANPHLKNKKKENALHVLKNIDCLESMADAESAALLIKAGVNYLDLNKTKESVEAVWLKKGTMMNALSVMRAHRESSNLLEEIKVYLETSALQNLTITSIPSSKRIVL